MGIWVLEEAEALELANKLRITTHNRETPPAACVRNYRLAAFSFAPESRNQRGESLSFVHKA